MKKLILVAASALALFVSSLAVAAQLKVGVVNYREVNKQTQFANKMRSSYQQRIKAFYKPMMDARKQITADKAKLNDAKAKLSKSDKKALKNKIKQQQAALNKRQQELRKQSTEFRTKIVNEFQDILKNAVRRIANKQGINMVLQNSSLIYSDNTIDLTNQVIAALNKDKTLSAIKTSATSAANAARRLRQQNVKQH